MKHGRKLTYQQKVMLKKLHLQPENWLAVRNTSTELVIRHRHCNSEKVIRKELFEN